MGISTGVCGAACLIGRLPAVAFDADIVAGRPAFGGGVVIGSCAFELDGTLSDGPGLASI